jgi:hypothetical protein
MLLAASAVLSTLAVVAMPLFLPLQHGMSIGIGDTVADKDTGQKIGAIIDAAKEDVQRIIEQYQVCAASTLVRSEPKSVQSLHACGAGRHHRYMRVVSIPLYASCSASIVAVPWIVPVGLPTHVI